MADWVFGDKVGGDKVLGDKNVYGPERRARSRPRVLIMSANADGRRPLRLDEEHREIGLAVRGAGDPLELHLADALRLDDLQGSLQHHRPVIAHFSGHSTAGRGILVSDRDRRTYEVPPEALSDLFRVLNDGLECVVLNACFTDAQARAIARHVRCVVGMRGGILDDAAVTFAAAFYRGIAYGETVGTAFELGRNQLRLHGHADAERPQLLPGPEAAHFRVVKRAAHDGW